MVASNSILNKVNISRNSSINKDLSIPLERFSLDLNLKIGSCFSLALPQDRGVADP
jgi:hypothetical protein